MFPSSNDKNRMNCTKEKGMLSLIKENKQPKIKKKNTVFGSGSLLIDKLTRMVASYNAGIAQW